jgi:hypothetical protein
MQTPTITIKLLHERRSGSGRRKIDGRSGKLYQFMWSDAHRAYCYTTSETAEIDDIFQSQGRTLGCYFAPVIVTPKVEAPKPLPGELALALLKNGIELPAVLDTANVARALVAAFDNGYELATARVTRELTAKSQPEPAPEYPPEAPAADSPATEAVATGNARRRRKTNAEPVAS